MTFLTNALLLASEAVPPEFIAATSAAVTNSVSITINKPAGLAVGDLMTCIVWGNNSMSGTGSGSPGWDLVTSNIAGSARFALFTRRVDGSEGSSFTFTMAGGSHKTAAIIATRGGEGAIDIVGAETEAGSGVSTAASIDATKPGVLIASFVQIFGTRTVAVAPVGMTQRAFVNSSWSTATYTLSPSPVGSTGSKTLTWSSSGGICAGFQIQIY